MSSPPPPQHITIAADSPTRDHHDYHGHNHLHSPRSPTRRSTASSTASGSLSPTGHGPGPASVYATGRRVSIASTFRRRPLNNTVTSSKYVTLVPGAEPGLSPGNSQIDLHAFCGITVVDFNEDQIIQTELDNRTLESFLAEPRPEWSKVRWINVNGLSWDCISALAQKWNLHRLALEDLLNTKNRTKCDWYSDHAFVNLAMLKLIHTDPPCGVSPPHEHASGIIHWFKGLLRSNKNDDSASIKDPETTNLPRSRDMRDGPLDDDDTATAGLPRYRSLQRYYGGAMNPERVSFMERHSSLAEKRMNVSVEQVSIFLTADNTVISFFENSADDVEPPILERLASEHTVLRSSCDASMMLQAIVDAIIDHAIPVVHAYQDQMADLEVNVLTSPTIAHTTALYILTSELSLLKQSIYPVVGLLNSLRAHKLDPGKKHPSTGRALGVEVSDTGKTYLADVEDHCVMLLDQLDTMKRGADNMIDLIFNTVSSLQNESMKKLTLVTILFLPLTFLTGYFGMNFEVMESVQAHSELYFWKIAVPLAVVTALWLLRGSVVRKLAGMFSRREIGRQRKERRRKERMAGGAGGGGGLAMSNTFGEG